MIWHIFFCQIKITIDKIESTLQVFNESDWCTMSQCGFIEYFLCICERMCKFQTTTEIRLATVKDVCRRWTSFVFNRRLKLNMLNVHLSITRAKYTQRNSWNYLRWFTRLVCVYVYSRWCRNFEFPQHRSADLKRVFVDFFFLFAHIIAWIILINPHINM